MEVEVCISSCLVLIGTYHTDYRCCNIHEHFSICILYTIFLFCFLFSFCFCFIYDLLLLLSLFFLLLLSLLSSTSTFCASGCFCNIFRQDHRRIHTNESMANFSSPYINATVSITKESQMHAQYFFMLPV